MVRQLFLDTMIYLHFRPVEDVDWPTVLGCERVEIVVPRITVQELDKHKTSLASNRLRDRARNTLSKFENWFRDEPYSIRRGTSIEYWRGGGPADVEALGLDPGWQDDRLIEAVLGFARMTGRNDVMLLSDDTGARLSARAHGIEALPPPDELRLPIELEPIEKENAELKRQLAKLRLSMPQLELQLVTKEGDAPFARFHLKKPALTQRDDASTIAALKNEHPFLVRDDNSIFGPAILPSQAEYDRYNAGLRTFFSQYSEYLAALNRFEEKKCLSFAVVMAIVNNGTAPADDVDVDLHFPDGFTLSDKRPELDYPVEPKVPTKPRSLFEMGTRDSVFSSLSAQTFLPSVVDRARIQALPQNVSRPRIRKGSSYDVAVHVRRVKHGDSVRLPSVYVTFESYHTAASFSVTYKLRAANVPEPITGRLDVVITSEATRTEESGADRNPPE